MTQKEFDEAIQKHLATEEDVMKHLAICVTSLKEELLKTKTKRHHPLMHVICIDTTKLETPDENPIVNIIVSIIVNTEPTSEDKEKIMSDIAKELANNNFLPIIATLMVRGIHHNNNKHVMVAETSSISIHGNTADIIEMATTLPIEFDNEGYIVPGEIGRLFKPTINDTVTLFKKYAETIIAEETTKKLTKNIIERN
jgi:hypothetical protein